MSVFQGHVYRREGAQEGGAYIAFDTEEVGQTQYLLSSIVSIVAHNKFKESASPYRALV
jgi:hypothetical protein